MANGEGVLVEKYLLVFLLGILVWFCPLFCWCRNLTPLELQGKQAGQVSTLDDFTADLAIDGDANPFIYPGLSCSHTDNSSHPWWKVDLGTHHCLGRITLVNRGDCCYERLSGAIVRAGIESDILDNAVCGLPVTSDQASIPGAHIHFVCDPPVVARFISVDDDEPLATSYGFDSTLILCEVMVEEYHIDECAQATTIGETTSAESTTTMVVEDQSFGIPSMSTMMFNGRIDCVSDQRPLLAVDMKSLIQCFGRCKMNNGCLSFDYVMTSGQCRFYDVKAGDLDADDQPGCLVSVVVRG